MLATFLYRSIRFSIFFSLYVFLSYMIFSAIIKSKILSINTVLFCTSVLTSSSFKSRLSKDLSTIFTNESIQRSACASALFLFLTEPTIIGLPLSESIFAISRLSSVSISSYSAPLHAVWNKSNTSSLPTCRYPLPD